MSRERDLGIEGLRWVGEIGSGGFGSVHQASDDAHGRDVAVKLLHGSTDERSLQRFDRERKLMGSVSNHPNIVTIHTSGFTSQNIPYLVMELVAGGSLSERLAQGTMTARATRDLGVILAEAMCVAHDTGVLHLDIKPENVLIGRHGEPQLADFGIASAASEISMRQTIAISPAFSPPELLNAAETDVRADVYSLAATLYSCVTGVAPYQQDGGGLLTTLARMANEPVPRAQSLDMPAAMADLLAHAMAKDAADRPPTMRAFADALAALDFGPTVPAAAASPPAAPAPPVPPAAPVPSPPVPPAAPVPSPPAVPVPTAPVAASPPAAPVPTTPGAPVPSPPVAPAAASPPATPVPTAPVAASPPAAGVAFNQPAASPSTAASSASHVPFSPGSPIGPTGPVGAPASAGGGGGISKPVVIVAIATLLLAGIAFMLIRGSSTDTADRDQQTTQPTVDREPTSLPVAGATLAPEPAPTLEGRPTPRPGPTATSAPEPEPTVEQALPPVTQDVRSINVAILGSHPQMLNIQELTPEYFTDVTGIEVSYTAVEETTLRQIATRDVGNGVEAFDVVVLGMFDAPQLGANGWLVDLNTFANNDAEYDLDDIFPAVRKGLSVDGALYGSPFYSESSFLMYRVDLLDEAGQTMPAVPTWDEVAAIARAVDSDETAGICLRGRPGWGDLGASFTTVLNTFGATWWAANVDGTIGESQVDQPEFAEALNFYVDLLTDAGPDDAANFSFGDCLGLYQSGEVAMWYDSTVAAGFLEADDSPVRGLNGYALAPVKVTDSSGWLWSWALTIPESAPDHATAWEYISWATSKQLNEEVAGELGWSAVAPATRQSLFEQAGYLAIAGNFASPTFDAMFAVPIDSPGTTPRPGVGGVQMVGVPEFAEVGTLCTQQFSAAIAGSLPVEDALAACHEIASQFES